MVYSSSTPTDELLAVTTKFAKDNGSSYKKALRHLKAGDELEMSDPMGDFVLPKLIQTPLVFVAGGIGITPFKSMLSWLGATHEDRPIKLLVGVNNEDEIVFRILFINLGFMLHILLINRRAPGVAKREYYRPKKLLALKSLMKIL
jgi:ferredoxin-NADP reductase